MASLEDIDPLYLPKDQFTSLGELYDLFYQGQYKQAFTKMYVTHLCKNYHATYVIGLYYEFGLRPIFRSHKDASQMYSCVIIHTDNEYLKNKAINRLKCLIYN